MRRRGAVYRGRRLVRWRAAWRTAAGQVNPRGPHHPGAVVGAGRGRALVCWLARVRRGLREVRRRAWWGHLRERGSRQGCRVSGFSEAAPARVAERGRVGRRSVAGLGRAGRGDLWGERRSLRQVAKSGGWGGRAQSRRGSRESPIAAACWLLQDEAWTFGWAFVALSSRKESELRRS